MSPLVAMAGPTQAHDPDGIKVIIPGVQSYGANMVRVELTSLATPHTPIAIAPKDEHAHTTPPRVTVDRAP